MPELSSVFSLVNYAFVLFFGIVAALYLADIGFCDHKRVYVLTLFFFGIAQLLFYLIMGESVLYKCYPFLIHIPLIALIFLRFHRNLSISAISVLSAYLLCTPRKWFGTFVAFFFERNPVVSNIASIIITIPLLVLVIRFVSPYIIRLKYESRTTLLLFFLLPLVYYVLEYTLLTLWTVFLSYPFLFCLFSRLNFQVKKIKQNGKIFCLLRLPHRHRKKLPSFPLPSSRQPFTGMTCDTI